MTGKPTPRQARTAKRKAAAGKAAKRPARGQPAKTAPDPAPTPPPAARPRAAGAQAKRQQRAGKAPPEDLPRTVADLILAGLGRDQVRAFIVAEADYRPGQAELDALIDQAKADLALQAEHYASIATELTIVRLNDLYTRALKVQDLKTALDVQKAIVRFLDVKALGQPPTAGGESEPQEPAAPAAPVEEPVPPGRPRLVGSYADVMAKHRRA